MRTIINTCVEKILVQYDFTESTSTNSIIWCHTVSVLTEKYVRLSNTFNTLKTICRDNFNILLFLLCPQDCVVCNCVCIENSESKSQNKKNEPPYTPRVTVHLHCREPNLCNVHEIHFVV